ncbi:MAG: PKD domain-containing protein [Cryomorphaceae bacterium]|nr:PKD domain-containing protein [Cryomorphaceae bacterium]
MNDDQIRKILSERFAEAEAPVSPHVWDAVSASGGSGGGLSAAMKILIWSAASVLTVALGVVLFQDETKPSPIAQETQVAAPVETDTIEKAVDAAAVQLVEEKAEVSEHIQEKDTSFDTISSNSTNGLNEEQEIGSQEIQPSSAEVAPKPESTSVLNTEPYSAEVIAANPKFTVIAGIDPMEVFFVPDDKTGDSYLWTFGDGVQSDKQTPVHAYEEPGRYAVTLQILKAGSVAEFTVDVDVFPPSKINLPNTFSPNNDGINDVIDLMLVSENIVGGVMLIYSATGELVFEGIVWDGNNKQGDPCNSGNYTCVAQGTSLSGEKITERQIIRLQR